MPRHARFVPPIVLFAALFIFALTTNTAAVFDLAPLQNVTKIDVGGHHMCISTGIGGVKCWGINTFDQLGNGGPGVTNVTAAVPNDPVMQHLCTAPAHKNRLNCNHDSDDYTNPAAGSYLVTYWNTGNNKVSINATTPTLAPAATNTPTPAPAATNTPTTTPVAGCSIYNSSNVPQTIPDLATVDSTLIPPDNFTLIDVNLRNLQIIHTFDSDLQAVLLSPAGTQVTLFSNVGSSGDNFTGTVFDDAATTAISSGAPSFSGRYRPAGSLSTFNGESSSGTWILRISDTVDGDTGVLNGWSLELCGNSATATATSTPTFTPTPTPTNTAVTLPSDTPTFKPTPTNTTVVLPSDTSTFTPTPTDTTVVLPGDTPTPTDTTVVLPGDTPTFTPTPTTITAHADHHVLLPLVVKAPPSTPTAITTPTSNWQPLSQPHLNLAALALQGDQLLAGERRDLKLGYLGGLYQRSFSTCVSSQLGRSPVIDSAVFGLALQGSQGVIAAYDLGMFYTNNGGVNWIPSSNSVSYPRVVVIGSGIIYAGTEKDGLYVSKDGGVTWSQRTGDPKAINVLKIQTTTLWIGADKIDTATPPTGVWKLSAGDSAPTQQNAGLNNDDSRRIWDFGFAANNMIYLATADGVYRANSITNSAWEPFDLQLKELRTLELVGDQLYVGVLNGGVWRHPLVGGVWQPVTAGWSNTATVRDLLYDTDHCKGLLAATNDGVWLYR